MPSYTRVNTIRHFARLVNYFVGCLTLQLGYRIRHTHILLRYAAMKLGYKTLQYNAYYYAMELAYRTLQHILLRDGTRPQNTTTHITTRWN